MVQAKVDTAAVDTARQWAERAAAESQDDAPVIVGLFASVGSASGDAAVGAAAREAGAAWGPSLAEGTSALAVLATSLAIAARSYAAAEVGATVGFADAPGMS